jgi:hypothetical protein
VTTRVIELNRERRLSFYISVKSGLESGPTKTYKAQQFIKIVDGKLDEDASYFAAGEDATGKEGWPGVAS